MAVLVLGAKTVIAVLLVAAGGAKLADLTGFAEAVRLFAPHRVRRPLLRGVAVGVAVGEIAAGAASLSSPALRWLNLLILVIGCGFVAVSVAGFVWHRDRACRCFGALSKRTFNVAGIGRAAAVAAAAALATVPVRPSLLQLSLAGRLALLAGAMLIVGAAWTAAIAVAAGRSSAGRDFGRDSAARWA